MTELKNSKEFLMGLLMAVIVFGGVAFRWGTSPEERFADFIRGSRGSSSRELAQVAPPSVLSLDALQSGQWYRIPNSKLNGSGVYPGLGAPTGNGPESVMSAWSGGAFDSLRNRLIIWGGGHNDYGGNELYAFTLSTQKWTRIWGPSSGIPGSGGSSCPETVGGGDPNSRHTYDGVLYIAPLDKLFGSGGSLWCGSGGGSRKGWFFNFSTNSWEDKGSNSANGVSQVSDYDPVSQSVFVEADQGLFAQFNTQTGAWTTRGSQSTSGEEQVGVIDPDRRFMIVFGNGNLHVWNLQTFQRSNPVTSGGSAVIGARGPAAAWDPVSKRVVAWVGGTTVYSLDPGTWQWQQHSAASTNTVTPPSPTRVGMFGRWQYVPLKNIFIMVTGVDQDVYAYKLSAGGGSTPLPAPPPPTPPPSPADTTAPSAPANLTVSGVSVSQINLSWSAATDNVGVTGYRLERCQGSSCTNFVQVATPTGTSYSDTGLLASTAYRYRVRSQDAAGNLSAFSFIASATTQASTPSLSGGLSITSRTWVSRPLSGFPVSYGGGKHTRLLFDSKRGRLVMAGGDYETGREYQDGNQYVWSLDAVNNIWTIIGQWCMPAGGVQPGRPDSVGWVYDSTRDQGVILPGFYFLTQGIGAGCPGVTESTGSMLFNFATNQWKSPAYPAPQGGYGGDNGSSFAVYDPATDSVYRMRWEGSNVMEILSLATNTWGRVTLDSSDMNRKQSAIDVQGRNIYAISSRLNALLRYSIPDRRIVETIPMPSQWTPPGGSDMESYLVFDPINRVLLNLVTHDFYGQVYGLAIYHVDTKQWEWEAVPSNVSGNMLGFDAANNAMVLSGRSTTGVYWLYRYGGSGTSVPAPTPTPTPTPTPLPSSTKFLVNDRVQTTTNLNVRNAPLSTATLLGTQLSGALGTVIGGPTFASNLWWWNINYDSGVDGWSAEDFLARVVVAPPPPPVPTPAPAPTPPPSSGGSVINATPSNYANLLSTLRPGDTLSLAAGNYLGMSVYNLNGTAANPISITGPATGSRAVILGSSGENTVRISNSSYVVLRNLEVNGRNLGGDPVNGEGTSHHITLENFYIHGCSDDQGTVGISTNRAQTWNWVIRGNTITDCGTGMYLGNSDGNEQFLVGLIEYNLIYDTIGYNAEFKQQNALPGNISGLPLATTKTVIRHNVFSKANNASGGSMARPNLLVGHSPLSGAGQENYYEIYGNFFYQNPSGEPLFQGEGNYAFHNNVLFNSVDPAGAYPCVLAQPHNDRPRDIRIFLNTIVCRQGGISITGGYTNFSQKVIGNAVFAANPINAGDQQGNITDTYQNAASYLWNTSSVLGSLDLTPRPGKLSGPALDPSSFSMYTDWNRDFNGVIRSSLTLRGAYATEGPNIGWVLQRAIKPAVGASVLPAPAPMPIPLPPNVSVLSPNGGESLIQGTSYTVTNTYDNTIKPELAYSLYKDGAKLGSLVGTRPSDTSFIWQVGKYEKSDGSAAAAVPGTGYKIALFWPGSTNPLDMSDAPFSIAASSSTPTPNCSLPNACGPALGMPNSICSDGTVGGPTGRCLNRGGVCGWEVISCPTTPPGAICTQDAKLCPDGSYVSRQGPNCEFAACPGVTPPPSTRPHYRRFLRALFRGLRHTDVAALQQLLIREGFLASNNDTGFFGPLTENAVRKFQCRHNIVCSGGANATGWGHVGPKTREKLDERADERGL